MNTFLVLNFIWSKDLEMNTIFTNKSSNIQKNRFYAHLMTLWLSALQMQLKFILLRKGWIEHDHSTTITTTSSPHFHLIIHGCALDCNAWIKLYKPSTLALTSLFDHCGHWHCEDSHKLFQYFSIFQSIICLNPNSSTNSLHPNYFTHFGSSKF